MMKRMIAMLALLGLVLTACSTATPTETDTQIATRVSQILTNMPTVTRPGPQAVTATSGPTSATKAPGTQVPASPTTAPPTATAVQATATKAATAVPATATATKAATAVPTTPVAPSATLPATDPRSTLGSATWRDAMENGNNWPTGEDPSGYTEIDFKDGQMLFTANKPVDGWRLTIPSAANFYLEMTVKTDKCLSNDRWGMLVRVPNVSAANQGYLFGINCEGAFALRKWDGTTLPKGTMTMLMDWKVNKAINAGAGKTNRIGFMARGSKISLYANGVLLGEVADATFTADGHFGVFAGAHSSSSLTIAVDEMVLWELP